MGVELGLYRDLSDEREREQGKLYLRASTTLLWFAIGLVCGSGYLIDRSTVRTWHFTSFLFLFYFSMV